MSPCPSGTFRKASRVEDYEEGEAEADTESPGYLFELGPPQN